MREFWYDVRREPEGALLIAANALGFVLVAWLLAIA